MQTGKNILFSVIYKKSLDRKKRNFKTNTLNKYNYVHGNQ